jgi:hypothetical protein
MNRVVDVYRCNQVVMFDVKNRGRVVGFYTRGALTLSFSPWCGIRRFAGVRCGCGNDMVSSYFLKKFSMLLYIVFSTQTCLTTYGRIYIYDVCFLNRKDVLETPTTKGFFSLSLLHRVPRLLGSFLYERKCIPAVKRQSYCCIESHHVGTDSCKELKSKSKTALPKTSTRTTSLDTKHTIIWIARILIGMSRHLVWLYDSWATQRDAIAFTK